MKTIYKYYIYRHIRLDSGEPFYIGMGSKTDKNFKLHKTEYDRAYSYDCRNDHWHGIVNLVGYEVEILFESNSYDLINTKEIEFIALYGRRDKNQGTLCNLTDGGRNEKGKIFTEKQRNHLKRVLKGKIPPNRKKVIDTETLHIYESLTKAAETTIFDVSFLSGMLKGKFKNQTSFMFLDEYEEGVKIIPYAYKDKRVVDTQTGKIYKNATKASLTAGISVFKMLDMLKGKTKNTTPLVMYEDYLNDTIPDIWKPKERKGKKVIDTLSLVVYDKIYEAAEANGMTANNLLAMLTGRNKNKTSCMYLKDYKEGMIIKPETRELKASKRKVINNDTGVLYETIESCADDLGIKRSTLAKRLSKEKLYSPNLTYYNN